MLFNFVSSNTGNFQMEKCWAVIGDPDNIHTVCTEMSRKRRLFVGTLRYYATRYIVLCLLFFRFSFFVRMPQVNFNSFWLCSCSTTHVNANEILESGEGDEMQKKIGWIYHGYKIFNTHTFSVAQLRERVCVYLYVFTVWLTVVLYILLSPFLTVRWALKGHIMQRGK